MSKEAMKLALEALQEVYFGSRSAKHDEAITALREALAEPTSADYAMGYAEGFNDACKPAQQEPAGWRPATFHRDNLSFNPGFPDEQTVKFWKLQGVEIEYCYTSPLLLSPGATLYTSPPAQRKPLTLTLQELEAAWNAQADKFNQWDELGLDEIVAWAQAAHNIKENT